MEKRFKASLFGFNKKDVNDYIVEITNEMAGKLASKDEKITSLNDKITALREQVRTFESERAVISDAIIKAKNEAEKIISEAIGESQRHKARLLDEIAKEKENLAKAKSEIWLLKQAALSTVESYQKQLDEIS